MFLTNTLWKGRHPPPPLRKIWTAWQPVMMTNSVTKTCTKDLCDLRLGDYIYFTFADFQAISLNPPYIAYLTIIRRRRGDYQGIK